MPHIALTSYELETGGISRVAVHLANGFAAAGHRVSLVLCSDAGDLDAQLRTDLDPAVEVVTLAHRGFAKRALGQIATWPAMRRWVRRARPDILLGTANNISWFTGLAAGGAGPRLFIKTTNPILREKDGPTITALRRAGYGRLFRRAEAVLTLSEQESAGLARAFAGPDIRFVAVANPYVSPQHAANLPQRGTGQAEGRDFLFLGRLEPQKNVPRLLRAFAGALTIAGARGADWSLTIAGDGRERAECEALAADLGIADRARFLGFHPDGAGLLAKTDCMILPSDYEGLPAVVPEALASGCPVISTDCFLAAREMLEPLPGCAVVERDHEALAQAIASFEPPVDASQLAQAAQRYTFEGAVQDHLRAMGL